MSQRLGRYFRYWTRAIPRFRVAQQGATAVEFALIAPAFLATLIAVLQTAVFLFAQAYLQTAAVQAGRLFMTGQAQNLSQAAFKTQICQNYLPQLFNCSSLVVVAQSYSSFASASTSAPSVYNAQGQLSSGSYSPGVFNGDYDQDEPAGCRRRGDACSCLRQFPDRCNRQVDDRQRHHYHHKPFPQLIDILQSLIGMFPTGMKQGIWP